MMTVLQPVGTSRPLSSLMGGALFVTGSPLFITGELLYVVVDRDTPSEIVDVVQVGTGRLISLDASTDVTLVVRSPDKSRNDLAFDRESGRG